MVIPVELRDKRKLMDDIKEMRGQYKLVEDYFADKPHLTGMSIFLAAFEHYKVLRRAVQRGYHLSERGMDLLEQDAIRKLNLEEKLDAAEDELLK